MGSPATNPNSIVYRIGILEVRAISRVQFHSTGRPWLNQVEIAYPPWVDRSCSEIGYMIYLYLISISLPIRIS